MLLQIMSKLTALEFSILTPIIKAFVIMACAVWFGDDFGVQVSPESTLVDRLASQPTPAAQLMVNRVFLLFFFFLQSAVGVLVSLGGGYAFTLAKQAETAAPTKSKESQK
jgi:hypothetical protein